MQVTNLLNQIERHLVSQKSTAGTLLQKGLSKELIQQKTAHLSYELSPEVYELYEWKNGIPDEYEAIIDDQLLFPWGIFQTLETSLEEHNISSTEGYWGRKHFPLFTTGGGDFLLVNLDPNDAAYGYIFEYSIPLHFNELVPKYSSLQMLLQGVLECYQKGAYTFPDGALEGNTSLRDQILKNYLIV